MTKIWSCDTKFGRTTKNRVSCKCPFTRIGPIFYVQPIEIGKFQLLKVRLQTRTDFSLRKALNGTPEGSLLNYFRTYRKILAATNICISWVPRHIIGRSGLSMYVKRSWWCKAFLYLGTYALPLFWNLSSGVEIKNKTNWWFFCILPAALLIPGSLIRTMITPDAWQSTWPRVGTEHRKSCSMPR
jgi:hypothetical protein